MKHDFKTSEDCTCDKFSNTCLICDGGLAICKVCGGGEGSLTTDCPGESIPYETDQKVYGGEIDYRQREGWVQKPNPTNQMWQVGHRIAEARDNGLKCYAAYGISEDCAGACDLYVQCRNDTKGVPV